VKYFLPFSELIKEVFDRIFWFGVKLKINSIFSKDVKEEK